MTFDRRYYTFNGIGEFILMEEDNGTSFTLQGRNGLVSFWPTPTILALAFGYSNLSFHVSIYIARTRVLLKSTRVEKYILAHITLENYYYIRNF